MPSGPVDRSLDIVVERMPWGRARAHGSVPVRLGGGRAGVADAVGLQVLDRSPLATCCRTCSDRAAATPGAVVPGIGTGVVSKGLVVSRCPTGSVVLLEAWCLRHKVMRFSGLVGPSSHGRTWSRSQNFAAT